MLSPEQLKRLLAVSDTLSPKDAQALVAGLGAEVNGKCVSDGLFWLRFVKTRDEADPNTPVKPFPVRSKYVDDEAWYLRRLWQDFVDHQVCVVAKSRQMLISWAIAAYCVWTARYRPHQAVYFQTQGWPDAVAMTCMPSGGYTGRCQFIEDNLPEWMRVDYKPSEGRIQYPNGSIIQALAGGANQIRGKTVSLYVGDEFAFQEEQDRVYTAVAPLIQKGAKAVFISTPNGANNQFSTLWHGRPVGSVTT